jgi:hypothetical protein
MLYSLESVGQADPQQMFRPVPWAFSQEDQPRLRLENSPAGYFLGVDI